LENQKRKIVLKVALIAPYPINRLAGNIRLIGKANEHASPWIVNLINELCKRNEIELHLIVLSNFVEGSKSFKIDNGITFHVKKTYPFVNKRNISFMQKAIVRFQWLTLYYFEINQVLKTLKTINPDVVHANGTENYMGIAAVKSGYPNVISIQGIISEILKVEPTLRYKLIKYLEKYTLRRAKFIIPKTKDCEIRLKAINPDLEFLKGEDLISPVFFQNAPPPFSKKIFFVGTLLKRKGIEDLIATIDLLSQKQDNFKVEIIGSGRGSYKQYLKTVIAQKKIGKYFNFHDHLTSLQIVNLFSKGGILFHPSHIENSPNAVMEAMSCGLPVVASNVGGITELVRHQETGYLTEKCNIGEYCIFINRLFNDPEIYKKFSTTSIKLAKARWHPEIAIKNYLLAYKIVQNAF